MNNLVIKGPPLSPESKVLVMVHGRGAAAQDILSIANYLNVEGFTLVAPQAAGHTWYPYSFLAPPAQNEPSLSSSLQVITDTINHVKEAGVTDENIYFLGFSQGACLVSEYTTRNATRYGGIIIYTGGLIGDRIYTENYKGSFNGTSVFIGTSNPDFHVPVERVEETVKIMESMNAKITLRIYDGMPHTISQDEITLTNQLIFGE
ncbi:alpha/beta hydrolase [Flavobacterium sp. RHBU_3]|uniref:alpha/beta hydrolase n=1 Tax=Flavobacterium sp. RHBU_3 TaxID=3391184 RepID=UPI00398487AC